MYRVVVWRSGRLSSVVLVCEQLLLLLLLPRNWLQEGFEAGRNPPTCSLLPVCC
jgi:hypothetical protein